MAESNERKRDDNDAGKSVGTGEGDFSGDTMATALESFGTVAGVVAATVLGYPKKEKK